MYLFTWMHEELRGRGLSALESYGYTLWHLTEELPSEHSVISLLFQGEHRHVIACGNCHHKSITLEPFTIFSLFLVAGSAHWQICSRTIIRSAVLTIIVPSARKVENLCVESSFKDFHLF